MLAVKRANDMSRKKFFSILGTGKYKVVCYYFEEQSKNVRTHYTQVATIKLLCNNFSEQDEIIIFTTKEAATERWLNDDRENNIPSLKSELEQLRNSGIIKCSFRNVLIPGGKNEKELWEIFSTIYDEIEDENELYIDVTHSFRSLPMFLIVLLNYAKVLKKVKIKSITYGNFEAREDDYVPLIDLKPLQALNDWTIAADSFINTGNPEAFAKLTEDQIKPILASSSDPIARKLNVLRKKSIVHFKNLLSVRGKNIIDSSEIKVLYDIIEQLKSDKNIFLRPFEPLLQVIFQKLQVFRKENGYIQLYNASQWCYDHNLLQQSYTLLIEYIITKICDDNGLKYDDFKNRELCRSAIAIKMRNIPENEWSQDCKHNAEKVNRLIAYLDNLDNKGSHVLKCLKEILDARNDFMHAGMRDDARKTDTLVKQLENIFTSKMFENF